jgi:HSP20 family protein
MADFRRHAADFGFSGLKGEIDQIIDRVWSRGLTISPLDGMDWAPPIDLVEQDSFFVLTAELPGISPDEIDLQVKGNVLTIQGRKRIQGEHDRDSHVVHRECSYGAFRRTIELPAEINAQEITARHRSGVLKCILPKADPSTPVSSVEISVDTEDPS